MIDRYYWSPRARQRKTQYKIAYPNNAPELLADIQSLLKAAHEAGALTVICVHIGENSRSIEEWALDTLRNTFTPSAGQRQADLVVITQRRTGRLG